MNTIKTVSFIGSGNVATNLAISFFKKGLVIEYVYSRTQQNAFALANEIKATPITTLESHEIKSELIIVALKDDILLEVLNHTWFVDSLLVHTSGSFNTKNLLPFSNKIGCIYPFQTFRKEFEINFAKVPFFIEANSNESETALLNLMTHLSSKTSLMNTKQRVALHIAGVGVNNFTHFILSSTKDYCEGNNVEVEYLYSLLEQTIQNSFYSSSPKLLQTGPARRGDVGVINNHLNQLNDDKEFKKTYKTISQLILDEFHESKIKL